MRRIDRITKLIEHVASGLYEREEVVAVALLAAVSGEHTFLLGPPGTAKSLISRRIKCAFKDTDYFEYLMNRFSTPEEIFGPVSIKALKDDKYTRKTDGYLPRAHFAFLDEIWKSSPAILNALLTLVNERKFRNEGEDENVPLKALISASNETPPDGKGLEALYDRFLVRLFVEPLSSSTNFMSLIDSRPIEAHVSIANDLRISNSEWTKWKKNIDRVSHSEKTISAIKLIRDELGEMSEDGVYVSDRRWQQASRLLKASAFLCGRKKTSLVDLLLLRHCLWSTEENRIHIMEIVERAVKNNGPCEDVELTDIIAEIDRLSQNVYEETESKERIYETVELEAAPHSPNEDPPKFIEVDLTRLGNSDINDIIYLPVQEVEARSKFHPVDKLGKEITSLTCELDSKGTIKIQNARGAVGHYRPWVKKFRDSTKIEVSGKNEISHSITLGATIVKLKKRLKTYKSRISQHQKDTASPFVPEVKKALLHGGIAEQIQEIESRIGNFDMTLPKIMSKSNLDGDSKP